MDLFAVMTEVDTRLKTLPGIRTTAIGTDQSVSVPAAVQYLPERINYDLTNGRGQDQFTDLVVVVFVGRANLRNAIKAITPYLKGTGPSSVKQLLDFATTPYTTCFDFQVQWSEVDYTAVLNGTNYLAALFHCNVFGSGA